MKRETKYAILRYCVFSENMEHMPRPELLPKIFNSIEEAVKGIEQLKERDAGAYKEQGMHWNDSQIYLYSYAYGPLKTLQRRFRPAQNELAE